MSSALSIGIDLGGTRVKAGVVDAAGTVIVSRVEPVRPTDKGDAAIVRLLADVIDRVAKTAGASADAPVGMAAAGVLDADRGVIRESPNFPDWEDLALGAHLAAATGRRVELENDANAVVLGEAIAGAGRGARHLVGLTLGTGVGGGIVLDGQLWRGARGMAAELGHVVVVRDGRPCGCGSRGCLEQYAGAVGLRQMLRELGRPELAETSAAPRLAADAARAGDAQLQQLFHELGEHVGVACAAFVHSLDVTRILLCGGIAHASDLFMEDVRRSLVAHTFRSMSEGVEIRVGELGEEAGIIGAAQVARNGG